MAVQRYIVGSHHTSSAETDRASFVPSLRYSLCNGVSGDFTCVLLFVFCTRLCYP